MKHKVSILILLISAVFFLISMNIKWSGQNWKNIICSDAKCYYMYLPGIFIYNDLNFGFVQEIENVKYFDVNNYRDCRVYINDKAVSKVTAGVALAQLPFFLTAHAYAKISGYPSDGYSKPYQLGVTLAAIFYLMAGLWFLHKLLNLYSISQKVQIAVIIACAFASNLFYYVLGEPGLSHVYSFAFISAMLYFLKRYFINPHLKYLFAASLLLGMNVMIRPANILILAAVPFVASSFENLSRGIMMPLRRVWPPVLMITLAAIPLALQSVIFYLQTGHFWIYTYGNESFNFLDPHFFSILFGFKKGLFIYTPLYLLSLGGMVYLYRSGRFAFWSLLIFLLFFNYVLSCWWAWWGGGSFSSRFYVDILPLFMILLALLLQHIRKKASKIILFFLLFLILALCQIQTYQYRYYQIHWENMDMQKYFEVFLRIDKL